MIPELGLMPEQRKFRRSILKRMVIYILVGAAFSWGYAQLGLHYFPKHGIDREWVGRIAVVIAIVTPLLGTVASFGFWWWEPEPGRRLWRKARRAFTRRPRTGYSSPR